MLANFILNSLHSSSVISLNAGHGRTVPSNFISNFSKPALHLCKFSPCKGIPIRILPEKLLRYLFNNSKNSFNSSFDNCNMSLFFFLFLAVKN